MATNLEITQIDGLQPNGYVRATQQALSVTRKSKAEPKLEDFVKRSTVSVPSTQELVKMWGLRIVVAGVLIISLGSQIAVAFDTLSPTFAGTTDLGKLVSDFWLVLALISIGFVGEAGCLAFIGAAGGVTGNDKSRHVVRGVFYVLATLCAAFAVAGNVAEMYKRTAGIVDKPFYDWLTSVGFPVLIIGVGLAWEVDHMNKQAPLKEAKGRFDEAYDAYSQFIKDPLTTSEGKELYDSLLQGYIIQEVVRVQPKAKRDYVKVILDNDPDMRQAVIVRERDKSVARKSAENPLTPLDVPGAATQAPVTDTEPSMPEEEAEAKRTVGFSRNIVYPNSDQE